jgi:hypothetical protein
VQVNLWILHIMVTLRILGFHDLPLQGNVLHINVMARQRHPLCAPSHYEHPCSAHVGVTRGPRPCDAYCKSGNLLHVVTMHIGHRIIHGWCCITISSGCWTAAHSHLQVSRHLTHLQTLGKGIRVMLMRLVPNLSTSNTTSERVTTSKQSNRMHSMLTH